MQITKIAVVSVELFSGEDDPTVTFSPNYGTEEGEIKFGFEVSATVTRIELLFAYGESICNCVLLKSIDLTKISAEVGDEIATKAIPSSVNAPKNQRH